MAYLPNHYDRGHSRTSLVAIYTQRDLVVYFCGDMIFQDGALDSQRKADLMRDALLKQEERCDIQKPLMEKIGAQLGAWLVLYDAVEFEYVIPHSIIQEHLNFRLDTLCTFTRDELSPWCTSSICGLRDNAMVSKDELQAADRLGHWLSEILQPNVAADALMYLKSCTP